VRHKTYLSSVDERVADKISQTARAENGVPKLGCAMMRKDLAIEGGMSYRPMWIITGNGLDLHNVFKDVCIGVLPAIG
jgi:hypothetical protein